MAQITEAQRVETIKQLLNELNKVPPERHEVARLPWKSGEPLLCPVIKIAVDEVLLNHQSHRLRAQLQDDPDWQAVSNDPHGETAQHILERHIRAARTREQFTALKESLLREGQTDWGVMTHKGVLVNANTRAVAIREFEDPGRRYIRVAVLPATAKPEEQGLLELRLQMQKELKVEYSLTNELLFIDELSSQRGLSDAQIAKELRIFPENEKKGAAEVQLRLRLLDLVHDMQRIPSEPLPLTFFDTLGYQQLRELHRSYRDLLDRDPDQARQHLESFLLSVAVGVTPVHQVRKIDASFMPDFMLPQLEEDELIGPVADQLSASTDSKDGKSSPSNPLIHETDTEEPPPVNIKNLIDIVTRRDKRVEVPGGNVVLEQRDVRDSIKAAIITGIKEKRREEKDADTLEAPVTCVKAATRELAKAATAVKAVVGDSDFDQKRRKSLEYAYNKLKKGLRDLETTLTKAHVIKE